MQRGLPLRACTWSWPGDAASWRRRCVPRLAGLALWALFGVVLPSGLTSQSARDSAAAALSQPSRDSLVVRGAPVPCTGRTVRSVIVLTQPPYTDKLPPSLDFVRRAMVRLHANTRDDVVRRYLLLEAGDPCTELARQESERILRVQPFLVDATVRAYDDGEGGVELVVETRDEFSVVGDLRIAGASPFLRGVRVGESNLAGRGLYASALWRDGGAFDDLQGLRFVDHQFLGRRNVGRLFGMRAPLGHEFGAEVLHPYLTDLQRFAWRVGYGGRRDYVGFRRPEDEGAAVALRRTYGDVGAVFRVGEPGRLRLIGASLTRERDVVDSRPVRITPDGFRDDSLAADFTTGYRASDVTRVNLLGGVRRLSFLRVEGFDALTGVQDMRVGVQSALMLGRSVPVFGARDNDWFVRHGLYVGGGSARSFVGLEAVNEARRGDDGAWDGLLTSGRLAWYYKPWRNQLTLTAVDWGGGWHVRVPFQLSFAELDGGLLGYRNSRLAGARRVVVRVEQRWLPNPRTTIGDLGLAFFADVGRLWSGDVPFATTSPVRGTLGVGVLAAVPRRSRRLWRVDFGVPVGGDPNARFEVRFTGGDFTRRFAREPMDVEHARERSLPRSLFTWP
jgi:hypothetical protein